MERCTADRSKDKLISRTDAKKGEAKRRQDVLETMKAYNIESASGRSNEAGKRDVEWASKDSDGCDQRTP